MRHFAEHGYHAARIEDLSAQLGVAKGSIFQYFGSKGGLFLEAYKKAVRSFPAYLDCPSQIREKGFFEILRYWLLRTERLVREDWIPYRVALLGNYGVDLSAEARDQSLSAGGRSLRQHGVRAPGNCARRSAFRH